MEQISKSDRSFPKPTTLSELIEQIRGGSRPALESYENALIQSGERFILIVPKNYEDLYLFEVFEDRGSIMTNQKAIYYSYGDFFFQDASTFIANESRRLLYPVTGHMSVFAKSIARQLAEGLAEENIKLIHRFDYVTCSSRVLMNLMSNILAASIEIANKAEGIEPGEIVRYINHRLFLMVDQLKEFLKPERRGPEVEVKNQRNPDRVRPLYDFVSNYTVIDIETTGLDPETDGITELAAMRVRDNEIRETFETLVDPKMNIPEEIQALTGITNEMIVGKPTICEALEKFLDFIGNDVVVGHNVITFDTKFINAKSTGRKMSNLAVDTMWIARKVFGGDLENLRLATIATALGVEDSQQHRALADTEMAFRCYKGMSEYAKKHGIIVESRKFRNWKASDIKPDENDCEDECLKGKVFVITGEIDCMSRKDAMQMIVNRGGIVKEGVTKATNYLILGDNGGAVTTKHRKAYDMMAEGKDIKIISVDEFMELVDYQEPFGHLRETSV